MNRKFIAMPKNLSFTSGLGAGNGCFTGYLLYFRSGVLAKPLPGPAPYSAIYHPIWKLCCTFKCRSVHFLFTFAASTSLVWL